MTYEDIIVSREGAVATLTFNRPNRLNATRRKTLTEVVEALKVLSRDDEVRVLVLTGAGDKAFMAGADIATAERLTLDQAFEEQLAGQRMCAAAEDFPKPVIARVNGIALGGGTELALSCDIRIAVDTAILGLPEITLGMIPGYGGTQRLPRLIGIGKAKQLIFTGARIKAAEAHCIGLVDEVVPQEELDIIVSNLCTKIAGMSPIALAMAKEAINRGMQTDIKTAMAIESSAFLRCFGSEDRLEGMRAFLEKRKPEFRGR